jgi:hypothetical protein
MPTKLPRINIALEEPLYAMIEELAKVKGFSLSMAARELIKEAIELEEESLLISFAEERDTDFDASGALSHEEVWD